jgi:hypothetical protein
MGLTASNTGHPRSALPGRRTQLRRPAGWSGVTDDGGPLRRNNASIV